MQLSLQTPETLECQLKDRKPHKLRGVVQIINHFKQQLTEAGILDWISVVVVDLVAALALVADDSLRGAVAPARLVVAVGGLAVALAGCKETQFKNQILFDTL